MSQGSVNLKDNLLRKIDDIFNDVNYIKENLTNEENNSFNEQQENAVNKIDIIYALLYETENYVLADNSYFVENSDKLQEQLNELSEIIKPAVSLIKNNDISKACEYIDDKLPESSEVADKIDEFEVKNDETEIGNDEEVLSENTMQKFNEQKEIKKESNEEILNKKLESLSQKNVKIRKNSKDNSLNNEVTTGISSDQKGINDEKKKNALPKSFGELKNAKYKTSKTKPIIVQPNVKYNPLDIVNKINKKESEGKSQNNNERR